MILPADTYNRAEVVPPITDPITLSDVKAWLRIDGDAENALLQGLLDTAINVIESITGRIFKAGAYTLTALGIRRYEFVMRRSPLDGVASVKQDGEDVEHEVIQRHGFSSIKVCQHIDDFKCGDANPLIIEFVAGYTVDNPLPPRLKTATLQLVAFYYENRGDCNTSMPSYITGLINTFKVRDFYNEASMCR